MSFRENAEEHLLSASGRAEDEETVEIAKSVEYGIIRKQNKVKEIELESNIGKVTAGIGWDFFGHAIDLDVTVVALDTYSFEIDAAYYNQRSILDASIIHSGDDKTGLSDGDNEEIQIDLSKLPPKCQSLWFIVNAFCGGKFTDVETARFTLYDGMDHSKILYSYGIGMAFDSTALLLGVLSVNDPYSDNKKWKFKMIESRGSGHNFVESKYLMIDKLNILYDEGIIMERPRDRNKKYELIKGDIYVIDPEIINLRVCLGWDASISGQNIDVDASVIIFNEIYRKTDIVSFDMTNYANAVVHAGDNMTGQGSGDDEVININLDKLDDNKEADILCVVINIFSGKSSFKSIQNCFARLVDDRNKELCRFNLSNQYDTRAMIMCHVEKRKNGCWAMITDGVGCRGNTADKSVDDAIKVLNNDKLIHHNKPKETDKLIQNKDNSYGAAPGPKQSGDGGGGHRCCCIIL